MPDVVASNPAPTDSRRRPRRLVLPMALSVWMFLTAAATRYTPVFGCTLFDDGSDSDNPNPHSGKARP